MPVNLHAIHIHRENQTSLYVQKNKHHTYEFNGFDEPGADVLFMVVFYRDALVLVRSFKMVGTV